jgi:hypothetical protein
VTYNTVTTRRIVVVDVVTVTGTSPVMVEVRAVEVTDIVMGVICRHAHAEDMLADLNLRSTSARQASVVAATLIASACLGIIGG